MSQCLMIETKDRRKFFTYEKNFPQLIDFAKTFDAEISVVTLKEGKILDLSELAPALCDSIRPGIRMNYELIETKLSPRSNSRTAILKNAEQIQNYILEKFLSGETVTLSDLKDTFRKQKLTTACFCNHIRRAVKNLKKEGINTKKIKAGKYRIVAD